MTAALPDFETLVETHSRELFTYLWRLLQDSQDAEDCLQETFLRAFRAYTRLSHAEHLRAWLYRIATNTARSHLRQRGRRQPYNAELPEDLPAREANPATLVSARLELQQVQAAVLSLPEKQRAALILTRYQGLSYPEAAAALDASEDAVRANVYQAARKLRALFPTEEREHASA